MAPIDPLSQADDDTIEQARWGSLSLTDRTVARVVAAVKQLRDRVSNIEDRVRAEEDRLKAIDDRVKALEQG